MVERQFSKLVTRVRFPSPAPSISRYTAFMTDTHTDHGHTELASHGAEPSAIVHHPSEPHALTAPVASMADAYAAGIEASKTHSTPLHMDEIASRIAKFYEMIRKVIDWKEDNVLRRAATERILKRLLFPKLTGVSSHPQIDSYRLAYTITADLIRGGHLPNDEIPQESILVVETALQKYLYLLKNANFATSDPLIIKRKINFTQFIIELAACEIEEILTHPVKETVILQAMTELLTDRIRVIPEDAMTPDEKKMHVFIASCRTLYDLDDSFILYQFLKLTYPEWHNPPADMLPKLATEIPELWQRSETILTHPLSRQFYSIAERVDTVFMLLGDVLDDIVHTPKKLKSLLENKEELTQKLQAAYDKRYITLKKRLLRLAIFSTLSVFLSNWVTFFIVEVPLAAVFAEGFSLFTAFIDFLVPTAVMFFLVMIIRPPGEDNGPRVMATAYRFLYEEEKKVFYEVRLKRRRHPLFTAFVTVMYFLMMGGVFGGVWYTFWIAGLPLSSVAFDTFTIALTVFAAVLIRNKSKELVVDERTSIWEFFLDMLSVPVAKVGSFLANKWKEYNIIAILFTFLIETPFVVILDFIDNWSQYLKERRSELH